jgi:hypothetical protein
MRAEKRHVTLFAAMAALVLLFCGGAWAQSGVTMKTGTLPDGAAYLIEVPSNWNGSWNTHVDYRRQFERSADAAEVRALYEQAGLDLEADLKMLNETARISTDPQATAYLERNIIYDGDIHIPVLTLHTTGDGFVVVETDNAYKQVVREDGNGEFLRRTFVARAGHCTFTPAETIAAVQTLLARLETGRWPEVDASTLNTAALSTGPALNIFATTQGAIVPTLPAFVDFRPSAYLRPFGGETEECEFGRSCDKRASLDVP